MPNNTVSGGNELLDAKKILERLEIVQGMKIADFGCGGAGHFIFPAAAMAGDEGRVYAVDILKTVLGSIKSRARLELFNNVATAWSNLEVYGATKIDNNSLDIGMLNNVLFQTGKRKEIIKESVRMIKPGGKFMVIDWKKTGAPFGPPVDKRVNKEGVEQAVKELGLKKAEEFEAGPYHFGMIFIK